MKLVAVTRIRNEDDLVEAFARHHGRLVDHHVFLDNESNDRTLEILTALRAEGLNISIRTSRSGLSAESAQNTLLLRDAAELGADWIIHLDCDEFIDPRPLGGSLHAVLGGLPAQAPCTKTRAINYHPTCEDDPTELVVPRRLRKRDPHLADFTKVFVRARVVPMGATIGDGNHAAYLGGTEIPFCPDDRLLIAHYYMRDGWQILAKAFVGMMKIWAAGQTVAQKNTGLHYAHVFENLRDHPEWLLGDQAFLQGTRPPAFYGAGIVDDPIPYLGDALRYTEAGDARLKAVRSITAAAERVARCHGALVDATETTRRMADAWGADFRELRDETGAPRIGVRPHSS